MTRFILALTFILTATLALAHVGVKDPKVIAWMAGMKEMGAAEKSLARMARGQIAFDPGQAQAAMEVLAREAPQVVPLFETPADDPKSEALPAIWTAFDDFKAKAAALETAVAAGDVSTPEALARTARAIGATCGACHDLYVED
ncbi:MAG: cytochrome c [Pseudomonadota bacterium]